MRISIFNYWYECPNCKKEVSHSSSLPLTYCQILKCHLCECKSVVENIKGEVEVLVTKYEDDKKEN